LVAKRRWLVVGLVVMATLFAAGCVGHVRGMKDVRWLTDAEKEKVVAVALNTTEAKQRLAEYGPEYKTNLGWVCIVWGEGGKYSEWWAFEYDVVAKGLPRGEKVTVLPDGSKMREISIPDSAEIYSQVIINLGEPPQWQVYVAINPDTGRVALIEENPFNTGPQKQIN
jgi:hypothetical protein